MKQHQKQLHSGDINKILGGVCPEIESLLRLAHKQNFRIIRTGSGHFKIVTPPGRPKLSTVTPAKTGEYRAIRNTRAQLRRIGVEVPRT